MKELSKTKASVLASLSSKKMRRKHGLFLAEGEKCALDMLESYRPECIVALPEWFETHSLPPGIAPETAYSVSRTGMTKISSLSTPPEILVAYRLPEETDCHGKTLDPEGLHLLLDGIQDPGNLGTIIRTADWFGFHSVWCSDDTADIYNPKTLQATMGSLARVKVNYTDLPSLLDRSNVKHVYGTLLDGKNIFSTHLERKGVIVMGNEGKGLSPEMRRLVTDPLLIPPHLESYHGESLNVAVASAIVMSVFRNR